MGHALWGGWVAGWVAGCRRVTGYLGGAHVTLRQSKESAMAGVERMRAWSLAPGEAWTAERRRRGTWGECDFLEQDALSSLGWSPSSWDAGEPPGAEEAGWEGLDARQRAHAAYLSLTRATWAGLWDADSETDESSEEIGEESGEEIDGLGAEERTELRAFLRELRFERHFAVLRDNLVDVSAIRHADDVDWEELGIPTADGRLMAASLKGVQAAEPGVGAASEGSEQEEEEEEEEEEEPAVAALMEVTGVEASLATLTLGWCDGDLARAVEMILTQGDGMDPSAADVEEEEQRTVEPAMQTSAPAFVPGQDFAAGAAADAASLALAEQLRKEDDAAAEAAARQFQAEEEALAKRHSRARPDEGFLSDPPPPAGAAAATLDAAGGEGGGGAEAWQSVGAVKLTKKQRQRQAAKAKRTAQEEQARQQQQESLAQAFAAVEERVGGEPDSLSGGYSTVLTFIEAADAELMKGPAGSNFEAVEALEEEGGVRLALDFGKRTLTVEARRMQTIEKAQGMLALAIRTFAVPKRIFEMMVSPSAPFEDLEDEGAEAAAVRAACEACRMTDEKVHELSVGVRVSWAKPKRKNKGNKRKTKAAPEFIVEGTAACVEACVDKLQALVNEGKQALERKNALQRQKLVEAKEAKEREERREARAVMVAQQVAKADKQSEAADKHATAKRFSQAGAGYRTVLRSLQEALDAQPEQEMAEAVQARMAKVSMNACKRQLSLGQRCHADGAALQVSQLEKQMEAEVHAEEERRAKAQALRLANEEEEARRLAEEKERARLAALEEAAAAAKAEEEAAAAQAETERAELERREQLREAAQSGDASADELREAGNDAFQANAYSEAESLFTLALSALTHSHGGEVLRTELEGLKRSVLRHRADDRGATEEELDDADDAERPREALIALIMEQEAGDKAMQEARLLSNRSAALGAQGCAPTPSTMPLIDGSTM